MKEIKIFKYPFYLSGKPLLVACNSDLEYPLAVQVQNGIPMIWIEHRPDLRHGDPSQLEFFLATTGNETKLPPDVTPLGTFQLDGGEFVGHVYWRRK